MITRATNSGATMSTAWTGAHAATEDSGSKATTRAAQEDVQATAHPPVRLTIMGATNRGATMYTARKGAHTVTAERGSKPKTHVARKDAQVVTAPKLCGTRKIVG